MTNMPNTLGDFIIQRRYELRLTQEDLAKRLSKQGIERTAATISSWETGRSPLPLELIEPLALALEEPSPTVLYELAGVLDKIPGSKIMRLLRHLSPKEVSRIERMIEAYVAQNDEENG